MGAPNAPKPNVDSNSVGVGVWSLRARSSSVAAAATAELIAASPLWLDSPSNAFHWRGVSQSFVSSCRADFGLRRMPRRRLSLIGRSFFPMALGSLFAEGELCVKRRHTNPLKGRTPAIKGAAKAKKSRARCSIYCCPVGRVPVRFLKNQGPDVQFIVALLAEFR